MMLTAEAAFDRELAGCAVFQPHAALALAVRPEVDLGAIAFFAWLDLHRTAILSMPEDGAILRIMRYPLKIRAGDGWQNRWRDFTRLLMAVDGVNCFERLSTIAADINAIRLARKACQWIEQSGVLERVDYVG